MFTKDELKKFRIDFTETVKDLEKKYNVKVELGSISFGETSFHVKMTCDRVNSDGSKKVDEDKFNALAGLYGLNAKIGDTYAISGITFTITDFDSKKPKYPVLSVGSDGKSYKAPIEYVNRMIAMNKSMK